MFACTMKDVLTNDLKQCQNSLFFSVYTKFATLYGKWYAIKGRVIHVCMCYGAVLWQGKGVMTTMAL